MGGNGTVVLRSPMTILAPDGCGRLDPQCAPKIAVNIVNRIFTFSTRIDRLTIVAAFQLNRPRRPWTQL